MSDTLNKIQAHLMRKDRVFHTDYGVYLKPAPRITCVDGFNISIQASESAYCEPRMNNGPWYMVELGYPSAPDDLIQSYAEDPARPTDTVYGWVPIFIVTEMIDAHGGIAE